MPTGPTLGVYDIWRRVMTAHPIAARWEITQIVDAIAATVRLIGIIDQRVILGSLSSFPWELGWSWGRCERCGDTFRTRLV